MRAAHFDRRNSWAIWHTSLAAVRLNGYAPACFVPAVQDAPWTDHLDGQWQAPAFGALLEILQGCVLLGAGPTRRAMPLMPLGAGRHLFTLQDGPSTRRICLCETGEGGFDLALSRAKTVGWTRIKGGRVPVACTTSGLSAPVYFFQNMKSLRYRLLWFDR